MPWQIKLMAQAAELPDLWRFVREVASPTAFMVYHPKVKPWLIELERGYVIYEREHVKRYGPIE